jgi:antitoxin VapB
MALSIKSERADRLARELAELTGESITEAVIASLERRLAEERRTRRRRSADDLIERFQALPVLDSRTAEEIIGYDDHGLPV